MKKHLAVKTKDGATFMTEAEFNRTPDSEVIDWKVPELTVLKSTASTEYNRPCVALVKDDWQWGIERYYELYHLKREPGLLMQLFEEIEHMQKWGYKVKFEGFLAEEE